MYNNKKTIYLAFAIVCYIISAYYTYSIVATIIYSAFFSADDTLPAVIIISLPLFAISALSYLLANWLKNKALNKTTLPENSLVSDTNISSTVVDNSVGKKGYKRILNICFSILTFLFSIIFFVYGTIGVFSLFRVEGLLIIIGNPFYYISILLFFFGYYLLNKSRKSMYLPSVQVQKDSEYYDLKRRFLIYFILTIAVSAALLFYFFMSSLSFTFSSLSCSSNAIECKSKLIVPIAWTVCIMNPIFILIWFFIFKSYMFGKNISKKYCFNGRLYLSYLLFTFAIMLSIGFVEFMYQLVITLFSILSH